jgi:NTP pyrophosphatase (non-canonical NTP hydrolase)
MEQIKFEDMVAALVKPGEAILASLTPHDCHVLHMAVGISGEAGELLDAVKKAVIYRKPIDMENVIEEVGDVLFYLEGVCQGFNITIEQCKLANIAKLGKRYTGLKYSDTAAIAREDKA